MMLTKLRILPYFCLLAAMACSGGAGHVGVAPGGGSDPVGGGAPAGIGGPVGGDTGTGGSGSGTPMGNTAASNATPLQGGFSDPGGDPTLNFHALSASSVHASCYDSYSNLIKYEITGNVHGPLGKIPMDGRVLRVVLANSGKFIDETLTGGTLEFQYGSFYFGQFEFSLLTTMPFQLQVYLLPEGAQSSGESPLPCSGTLCSPPGANEVNHSLDKLNPEITVLQTCSTSDSVPVL